MTTTMTTTAVEQPEPSVKEVTNQEDNNEPELNDDGDDDSWMELMGKDLLMKVGGDY